MTLGEMDDLWNEAKCQERKNDNQYNENYNQYNKNDNQYNENDNQ